MKRNKNNLTLIIIGIACFLTAAFINYIASPWKVFTDEEVYKEADIISNSSKISSSSDSSSEASTEVIKKVYDTELGNINIDSTCDKMITNIFTQLFNVGYRQIISGRDQYSDVSEYISPNFATYYDGKSYNSDEFTALLADNIISSTSEIKCTYVSTAEIIQDNGNYIENGALTITFYKNTNSTFFMNLFKSGEIKTGKEITIPVASTLSSDKKILSFSFGDYILP